MTHAEFYGEAIGRLPKILRRDLNKVWIHDSDEGIAGGLNALILYTDRCESLANLGQLDETLFWVSVGTSLEAQINSR